jgi:hypothetical protein
MTGDDMTVWISKDRVCEAECFDGRLELVDLTLRMGSRVARIGNEVADGTIGDGQPRRDCNRGYLIHDQEYLQAKNLMRRYHPLPPKTASISCGSLEVSVSLLHVLSARRIQRADIALHAACFRVSNACFAE